MGVEQDVQFICKHKLIAIARLDHPEIAPHVAKSLAANDIRILEITMTTPKAPQVIAEVIQSVGEDVLVGAGTCTTVDHVRKVTQAGARFVVSPCFFPQVVKATLDAGAIAIPGCMTPTEILTAHRAGATFVKVFPASIGGPSYIRTLRGLFPEVRLIPTGGIGMDNITDFAQAGAHAIGVGGNLVKRRTEDDAHLTEIAVRASTLVEAIAAGPKKKYF